MYRTTPPESARKFVSWETLLYELDTPKSTIYDWIKQGIFPRPIPIGPRRVAFCRQQVEAWKAQRMASSSVESSNA